MSEKQPPQIPIDTLYTYAHAIARRKMNQASFEQQSHILEQQDVIFDFIRDVRTHQVEQQQTQKLGTRLGRPVTRKAS